MEENITATPTPEAALAPKRKKKGLLIGGILAAALVLAAGAFFVLRGTQGSTPTTTSEEDTLFHCGLVVVKSGDKWGYIDKTGKYVINPQFDDFTTWQALLLFPVVRFGRRGFSLSSACKSRAIALK